MENLKQLIKKCKFNHVNVDITKKHFPRPDKIQIENWKLIRFNEKFTSQEVLKEIKKQGCRPANCWELIKWAIKHKKELKIWEWCIALGQEWVDSGGGHCVPYVYRYSGDDFGIRLGYFEGAWGDDSCVLCFYDLDLNKELKNQKKMLAEEYKKVQHDWTEVLLAEIEKEIVKEMNIANKENQPTSRLTSLSMKIDDLREKYLKGR
jgi:hypothetical protein